MNLNQTKNLFNSLNFFGLINVLIKFLPILLISPRIAEISENHLIFWYLLMTIFSFTTIADFGINAVSTRYLSYIKSGIRLKNIVNKDKIKASNSNVNTKELCLIAGTISHLYFFLCFLYICFSFFILKIILNNDKFLYIDNFYFGAYVVLIFSWINLYLNKYVVLIQSFQNIKTVYKIQIISNLFSIVVSYLCVLNSSFILSLVALYAWPLIALVMYLCEVLKICDSLNTKYFDLFNFKKIKYKQILIFKVFLKPISSIGFGGVFQLGLYHSLSVISSKILVSKEAVIIMFYLQAVRGIASISQIHFYARLPSLQALFAKENLKINFQTVSNRIIFTSVYLYLFLAIIFLLTVSFLQLFFTSIAEVNYLALAGIFICVLIERIINYKLHIKALNYVNRFHSLWFFSSLIFFTIFLVIFLSNSSHNFGSYIIIVPYILSSLAALTFFLFKK